MNLLDKQICLKLNALWQPVGLVTIRSAVTFLCSESHGEKPGYVIDFETEVDENGEHVLTYANPVSFEEWLKLPVREQDLSINTSSGPIRLPLVVICARFSKVPKHTTRWSTGNVHLRDNYTCIYTGEKLTRSTASVDHIIPRSRGGRDEWTNTASCHKKINTIKADKTPEEAGLVPRWKPVAPKSTPIIIRKENAPLAVQTPFLM